MKTLETATSNSAVRKIAVVGGGTAGWITASLLAAEHCRLPGSDVEVCLIESPDIPIIGVGEGTWPSMRTTLQKIGLTEAELITECDASFKQGTQFNDWCGTGDNDVYYHPFSLPAEFSNLNLADYWLQTDGRIPFADFVTPQARVIAESRSPKQTTTPEYAFNVNYGYHFDASKFAALLHKHGVNKLNVRFISANVDGIDSHANGDIAAVRLANGDRVEADLFVDCTGHRSLLIGGHYGVPRDSMRQYLFNDSAIAVQVPYASEDDAIAPVTHSTAKSAGWIWDIGLQSRRGTGYVYSSDHISTEQALKTLKDYVGQRHADVDQLSFRELSFEPGYRREFWVNNCVAVGLSAGFVEPLEASALVMVEQSAAMISKLLPASRDIMAAAASRFNQRMLYHWQSIIEFLKLHYLLSGRRDSAYWQACQAAESCPPELREKLLLWQQRPPWHEDEPRLDALFPSASYQYVLYGMGFTPRYKMRLTASQQHDSQRVDALLQANQDRARQMVNGLPTNRELVNAMRNRQVAVSV